MDDQVKSLRQQVAAAEFLVRSLKTQLREAEERAASRQPVDGSNNRSQETNPSHHRAADPSENIGGNRGNAEAAQNRDGGLEGETISSVLANLADGEGSDDDAPGEGANNCSTGFHLPSIDVGTTYATLEDIKQAVVAHAVSQGWTCGVHKRDKTRLLLRCRTGTDCPFHLRAEQYAEAARICSLKREHNCNFQPDQSHVARSHISRMKFLREQLPTFMALNANTTASEISDAIFQRFGTRVSVKQCQNLRLGPKRRRAASMGTCSKCGAIGHNRITCGRVTEQQHSPSD